MKGGATLWLRDAVSGFQSIAKDTATRSLLRDSRI